ncbi:MAG: hypothetical protein Q4E57_07445 [Eubacteriales bacterium]|nr:hypothetical protein [Eubacteriales bacterium]
MVELFESQIVELNRHSSKGNQLKWRDGDTWYKADYMGYEGLSEYLISQLLKCSSLNADEYVLYEPERIRYKRQIYNGVRSQHFLQGEWQIITLERLFANAFGGSLHESVWHITDAGERFKFLFSQVERLTGLHGFGSYMAKLLTIDAFFLNEDRHTHNIAVLMNAAGEYRLCPIFDNGGALLSDTKLDFPLSADVYELMHEVRAKTISADFDDQLDAAEQYYSSSIRFTFDRSDVDALLSNAAAFYSEAEIERVRTVVYQQMRKYSYLFSV